MLRKPRHCVVAIECDLPPGITPAEFKNYALGAVASNIGGLHPQEPLFQLDRKTVQATIIPRDIEWFFRHTSRGVKSALYRRWFA